VPEAVLEAGVPEARARTRRWEPGYALDVRALVAPLRHGKGDPTCRVDEDGTVWRVGSTPAGPATTRIRRQGTEFVADAWGDGAEWVLDGLPALLGADDDDSEFVGHHPLVADARKRLPGLRLGSCGAVWDQLFAAILEQKVTGIEAHRSWRELCWRFGTAAPGPAPKRQQSSRQERWASMPVTFCSRIAAKSRSEEHTS